MNPVERLIQDLEIEEQFDDLVLSCPDKIPLIDEGNYDAIALACRRERRFRRDLLAFKFRIVSQGAAFGVVLPGYCNLDFGRGRGRKLPERSKLATWLRRIQAFDKQSSPKKLHLRIFGTYQFVVRVTTSRGTPETPLPIEEHYSTVTDILGITGRITGRGTGR